MSHFAVYVMIPGDTNELAIQEVIGEVLAPYNEELKVSPYRVYEEDEDLCRAYDYYTKELKQEEQDEKTPQINFPAPPPQIDFPMPPEIRTAWEEYQAREKAFGERLDAWRKDDSIPMGSKFGEEPPPDFKLPEFFGLQRFLKFMIPVLNEFCGQKTHMDEEGKLYHLSTFNKNSKWDWWVVGGRWEGHLGATNRMPASDLIAQIDPKPSEEERARKQEEKDRKSKSEDKWDRYCAQDIDPDRSDADKTPFALVDSSGAWHEKGRMGWWAMVSGEKERQKWVEEVRAILEREAKLGSVAVCVDCHV